MVGGVLEACERLVDLERLSHVLSELRAHIVLSQTTNKSQKGVYQRKGVSAAADTFVSVTRGDEGREANILERCEAVVHRQSLAKRLCARTLDVIVLQTVRARDGGGRWLGVSGC